jgi:RNA polymerase primary sigma factor
MRQLKISRSITIRESHALEKYLQEIGKVDLITAEAESNLCIRIRQGDEKALHQLVKANLRFVVSVAKQYQNQGVSLSDLINEGNVGLITAAQRFDETKGFKFISYAVWWIRQAILQALAEHSRLIRLPLNKVALNNKIMRANSELEQQLEREPLAKEVADHLGIELFEVEGVLYATQKCASIDAPVQHDEEGTLAELLEDPQLAGAEKTMVHMESLRKDVAMYLGILTERQRNILKLYFGIGVSEPYSLEDIAAHYQLTRERVRQIKDKALAVLRTKKQHHLLKAYL